MLIAEGKLTHTAASHVAHTRSEREDTSSSASRELHGEDAKPADPIDQAHSQRGEFSAWAHCGAGESGAQKFKVVVAHLTLQRLEKLSGGGA